MRTYRLLGLVALSLTGWACGDSLPPLSGDYWVAELVQSQQVLRMEFRQTGEHLSGSAALALLTDPGVEALTLAGTQHADTLDIGFARGGVTSFRFLGWYVN